MNRTRLDIKPGDVFGCWTVLSEVTPRTTDRQGDLLIRYRRFNVKCRYGQVETRYMTNLRRKSTPRNCNTCMLRIPTIAAIGSD